MVAPNPTRVASWVELASLDGTKLQTVGIKYTECSIYATESNAYMPSSLVVSTRHTSPPSGGSEEEGSMTAVEGRRVPGFGTAFATPELSVGTVVSVVNCWEMRLLFRLELFIVTYWKLQ
jgi:hypothetical protein